MNPDDSSNPNPAQRQQHISARVPDHVSRGVFSTGLVIVTGGNEFILDFIQNLGGPPLVSARVIMPHGTLPQFIDALGKNLDIYTNNFGVVPEAPVRGQQQQGQQSQQQQQFQQGELAQQEQPVQQGQGQGQGEQQQRKQHTLQEIYDELKLPDDMFSGAYANGVMIGHSASEFKFDFLTNLYPTTAVSCRVYLAAPQVPRMYESLKGTWAQFQQRIQQQQQQQRFQQNQGQQDNPESDAGPDDPPPDDAPIY